MLLSWVSWRAGRVVGCWAQRVAVTRGCSSADWLAVRLSAQEVGWLWMAVAMALLRAAEEWLGADELGPLEGWLSSWLLGLQGGCYWGLLEHCLC